MNVWIEKGKDIIIYGKYSSPHLVIERMEELMEGTSLEESGWFQRERSFKLPVLCRGMVGFGQRRIFGTAGKEHPSPPLPSPAVGEVLKPVELQLEVMDYNRICHQYFFIFLSYFIQFCNNCHHLGPFILLLVQLLYLLGDLSSLQVHPQAGLLNDIHLFAHNLYHHQYSKIIE